MRVTEIERKRPVLRGEIKFLVVEKKLNIKNIFSKKKFKTYRIYFVLHVNENRNSKNSSEQKYLCLEIKSQTLLGTETPVLFCYPDGGNICFEGLEQNY